MNPTKKELSYFRLKLEAYLSDYHPELMTDTTFITARADAALTAYDALFNCFVRPNFDGSHQSFPNLDLKRLGIPDLYKSQKDAVWMLKTNGGGICDHEVVRP